MFSLLKRLFGKKQTKEDYSYTIREANRKKNWLGFTKVYDSYDSKYSWCFIRLQSFFPDDDEIADEHDVLTIGFGAYYKQWICPFNFIKPVVDYHSYKKDENGKELEPKEIWWTSYANKEYCFGFLTDEQCFYVHWNYVSNMLHNITKHKSIYKSLNMFWGQGMCTLGKYHLLNLDRTVYKDVTKVKWEDKNAYEATQPYIEAKLLDFDKLPVVAIGKLERRVYYYGNKYFITKWLMRLFKKPIDNTYLDIEFKSEIGNGKGSWKGGTVGQAIKMLENELPEQAMERYCSSPEARGFRSEIYNNLLMLEFSYYKDFGITDSIPVKTEICKEPIAVVVDYSNRGFSKDKKEYIDLNLKFFINGNPSEFSKGDITHLIQIGAYINNKNYYTIKDERHLTKSMFKFYVKYVKDFETSKVANSPAEFNYYFTEKAVNYLKTEEMFKYADFKLFKNDEVNKMLKKFITNKIK